MRKHGAAGNINFLVKVYARPPSTVNLRILRLDSWETIYKTRWIRYCMSKINIIFV